MFEIPYLFFRPPLANLSVTTVSCAGFTTFALAFLRCRAVAVIIMVVVVVNYGRRQQANRVGIAFMTGRKQRGSNRTGLKTPPRGPGRGLRLQLQLKLQLPTLTWHFLADPQNSRWGGGQGNSLV